MFNKLDISEQWSFCGTASEQQITAAPLQGHPRSCGTDVKSALAGVGERRVFI